MERTQETYHGLLDDLGELERDWNSYGADPIDPGAIQAAQVFIDAIIDGRADIVPEADGGVSIEVQARGMEISVEMRKHWAESGDRQWADVDGSWGFVK